MVLQALYERFIELLLLPSANKEVIWIILPLILAVLFMELYFGRYKLEDIGWNTAFNNSLILIFVSVNLVKHLYDMDILLSLHPKTVLTIALIIIGIFMSLFNYFHILPKKFAFLFSSTLPINITNFMVVLIVYSSFPLDILTFIAALLYALIIYAFVRVIWFLIPESFEDEEEES